MKPVLQIMVFEIGTGYFGIESNRIIKIIRKEDAQVSLDIKNTGILSWQGIMVPVFNLHEKLQKEPLTVKGNFIILGHENKMTAFLADRLDKLYNVPMHCIVPVPVLLQSQGIQYFEKIANLGEKMVLLLNNNFLFNRIPPDQAIQH